MLYFRLTWLLMILGMITYALVASSVFIAKVARKETTTKMRNVVVSELQVSVIIKLMLRSRLSNN